MDRIVKIVAIFIMKQQRKEESNSDSFCNTQGQVF